MAEYIEREALIKKLNEAPAYFDSGDIRYGIDIAIQQVIEQPTADVVPVVRCKDCEYFFPQVGFNSCEKYSENHTHYIVTVDENDYCSKGEGIDKND